LIHSPNPNITSVQHGFMLVEAAKEGRKDARRVKGKMDAQPWLAAGGWPSVMGVPLG
jgi:hypothetical protein